METTPKASWFQDKDEWAGLSSVCRVDSKRTVKGVESSETRYYISSLKVNPDQALKAIRAHWGVENKLHCVLDVEFGEDSSRVRKLNAAENLNTLRKFAIDFLRKDRTTNHTFKKKRRIMMWNDEMLQRIIIGR